MWQSSLSLVRAVVSVRFSSALKKAEMMHRGFAVVTSCGDPSALPKEFLTQLMAPSTFSTKSPLELFSMIQSNFSGEDALHSKANRTLWKPIGNAGVVREEKRSIDEGNAWCTSTTRLLQTV